MESDEPLTSKSKESRRERKEFLYSDKAEHFSLRKDPFAIWTWEKA
jgi:hypothetical protein